MSARAPAEMIAEAHQLPLLIAMSRKGSIKARYSISTRSISLPVSGHISTPYFARRAELSQQRHKHLVALATRAHDPCSTAKFIAQILFSSPECRRVPLSVIAPADESQKIFQKLKID